MDLHDGYGRAPGRRERAVSRRAFLGLRRGTPAREDAFAAESERRRRAWSATGDELLRALGPVADAVVSIAGIRAGEHVLDPAAADGDVALAAARRGARVEACEGTQALAGRGRERTAEAVRWRVAPVTALPHDDGAFDVVACAFGVAMAPRARAAALELARVLRPGGRLVMAAWSPRGLPGALDAEVPQPEGVPPPSAWADPVRAARRLEDAFEAVAVRTRTVPLSFPSADAMLAALAGPLGVDDAERARLRPRFDALLAARNDVPGAAHVSARYVLIEARRAPGAAG